MSNVVTNLYKSREAARAAGGPAIVFKTFAFGDGNGQTVTPTTAGTGLVNEVYRGTVAGVQINSANPFQIDISCPLPAADANGNWVGPWYARELMVLDADGGQLVAGACSFNKSAPPSGDQSQYTYVVSIVVSDTSAVVVQSPGGVFVLQSDLQEVQADMADLLALLVFEGRGRLELAAHVRAADERAFITRQRLAAANL